MFERHSSNMTLLAAATLPTLPAAIAAQPTATQEPSGGTPGDAQQGTW